MKKVYVSLPDSFYKGLICKVHVSLNGKKATKELKVCMVKSRSITFMEVDKVNRQNIFRKVDRTDIVGFSPTAICEILLGMVYCLLSGKVLGIVLDKHLIQ